MHTDPGDTLAVRSVTFFLGGGSRTPPSEGRLGLHLTVTLWLTLLCFFSESAAETAAFCT